MTPSPPDPAGTEHEVQSRSGVPLVVVLERVGLPYRVPPMALPVALAGLLTAVVFALTEDRPGSDEDVVARWSLVVGLLAGWYACYRLGAPAQRWAVRRWSRGWKAGVVSPDPGLAPRGQWVVHDERLAPGADPLARLAALVADVESGELDARRRVRGLRASLRRGPDQG